MELNEYEAVGSKEADELSWTHVLRQILVSSVIWAGYIVYGMAFGSPAVFIPQINRENNSTITIDETMKSWLAAIFDYGQVPWSILLPLAAGYIGRKKPYMISCTIMFISSILLYCSTSLTHIFLSEAMICIVGASISSVAMMILGEYLSPKYRGLFFTLKSATFFWGVWISNAIGTFFHWKYIALVMMAISLYATIVVFFIPESPYHLARKSKFDECVKTHRWLKGFGKKSDSELCDLLAVHEKEKKNGFFESVMSKRFYKGTLLGMCLFASYDCTGKLACAMYSLDIIKKLTSEEKTAYVGMLILDGITVFSMYSGTVLSRYMRRKLLFIISTTVGIVSLFILSLYVYLTTNSMLLENKYLALILLSTYSIGIGCGPMILCTSIFGEILPIEYKGLSIVIVLLMDNLLSGGIMKFTPIVISKYGLHVGFFLFGISSSILVFFLYLYMPETKDKTLFEIAEEMSRKKKRTEGSQTLMNTDDADDVM